LNGIFKKGIKMGKIYPQEVSRVKQWIKNGANFMFIPSYKLLEMTAKNKHPKIKKLPDVFKYVIMQNKPIRIEPQMALDYYEGKLDENNTFLLSHGDIKIIPQKIHINKGEI